MIDNKDKQIVAKLKSQFKKEFDDFKGIYFYGSRVKGTYRKDSDIDIVVLFEKVDRDKRMKIWSIVGELEYQYDVFIDLHPMTKEELEQNPFYYDQVVNNGIFYEAA